MTATGQLSKDEIRVLRPGLQAKIAEEQEAEAAKLAGEEARRREIERLERRVVEKRAARKAYFHAWEDAATGMSALVKKFGKIYETAKVYRGFADTGKEGFRLSPAEITKRLGDSMSVSLRSLPAEWIGRSERFGGLIFAKYFARYGVWAEGELKKFGKQENQDRE